MLPQKQANLSIISAIAACDYTLMRASAARLEMLACEVSSTLRSHHAPPILSAVIDHAARQLRDAVDQGSAQESHVRYLANALDVALAWVESH